MNITRREAMKHIAAGAGALAAGCGVTRESSRRPNIIFVMTDDQTVDQMSCYGHPFLKTPNMDRIANEGTRFTNCFCTNSLCAPSRACVLTGAYSALNGIRGNSEMRGAEEALNPDLPTFPELLQQAGYYTALIGKYHIRQDPTGFDEWRILPGQGEYFDPEFIENGVVTQNTGYVTDVITDKTMTFLESRDLSQPFCLVYQHKGPHRPFKPAPRHANLWEDVEFPYPETFEDDYATRRVAAAAEDMRMEVSLPGDYPDLPTGLTDIEIRRWIYQRMAKDMARALVSIDEGLGRILDFLDEKGIADDTMVIYTADNGFFVGEHGWYDKRFMYEPSIRLPLVMRYPRIGLPGQVIDSFALNVDFAPTILDAAGIPIPDVMHGRSLKQILEGNIPDDWRESAYYAYYEDSWRMYQNFTAEDLNDTTYTEYFTAHRVGPHHGVRTARYKLIEYYTENYWELFDLEEDPGELNNIYGRRDTDVLVQRLKQELSRLELLYGDIQRSE